MQTRTLEVSATSSAAPDQVWRLLADVRTWSEWGAFDESRLERPGHDHPDGVGAIRRFRSGPIKNIEEVVRFDPTHALSYEVRESDIPMRHYRADVTLAPTANGGTEITWRSRFDARWPVAPIIERRLRAFIKDIAGSLADAAQNGGKPTPRPPRKVELRPIGTVHTVPTEASDDDWGDTEATIALDPRYLDLSALHGLDEFSHIEVIYLFHLVLPESVVRGARRPRDNRAWPRVGILAQRARTAPTALASGSSSASGDSTRSTARPFSTSSPTCRNSTPAAPSTSRHGRMSSCATTGNSWPVPIQVQLDPSRAGTRSPTLASPGSAAAAAASLAAAPVRFKASPTRAA